MELDLGLEPQDPSILEWARAQGICVNYETELSRITTFQSLSNDDFNRHLHEPSDATITTAVNELVKERLTVNKDTALLLKAVHPLHDVPATDPSVTSRPRRRHDLKQELPVLRSDHELDLLNFGNTAVPNLLKLQIPFEITIQENDEGFEWPTKYLDYPARCDARVRTEKLTISRDVLVYLQDTMRDTYSPEDGQKLEVQSLVRKHVCGNLAQIRLLNEAESYHPAYYAAFTSTISVIRTIYSILAYEPPTIGSRE
jgi:hypothetical protein